MAYLIKELKRRLQALIMPVRPYCLSLDKLVARCVGRMRVVPLCPYGHGEMKFRHATLSMNPIRDDTCFKCPKCFFLQTFGLPLTMEVYECELNLRGGRWLQRPTYRIDERSDSRIKKRLKALGYLG